MPATTSQRTPTSRAAGPLVLISGNHSRPAYPDETARTPRTKHNNPMPKCDHFFGFSFIRGGRAVLPSNENKMSDGWRGSAWLRVEGGISWQVWDGECQTL